MSLPSFLFLALSHQGSVGREGMLISGAESCIEEWSRTGAAAPYFNTASPSQGPRFTVCLPARLIQSQQSIKEWGEGGLGGGMQSFKCSR